MEPLGKLPFLRPRPLILFLAAHGGGRPRGVLLKPCFKGLDFEPWKPMHIAYCHLPEDEGKPEVSNYSTPGCCGSGELVVIAASSVVEVRVSLSLLCRHSDPSRPASPTDAAEVKILLRV